MLDLSVHCKVGGTLWEFWDWNGGTAISARCQFSMLLAPVRGLRYCQCSHHRVVNREEGFV